MKFQKKLKKIFIRYYYSLVVILAIGVVSFIGSFYYVVMLILLILAIELLFLFRRYMETGSLCPSSPAFLGMFEYDDLVGYNLSKDFSTIKLWKGSTAKRKKLDQYFKGMGKYISTNSARYRGKLVLPKKDTNTYRIVILGESTTFGALNDDAFAWPLLLERELNRIGNGSTRFEVLNFAVGGYKIEQCVKRYLRDFLEYDVDLLLNSCFFTDFKYFFNYELDDDKGIDEYNTKIKLYFSQNKTRKFLTYFWKKSISYFLLRKSLIGISKLNRSLFQFLRFSISFINSESETSFSKRESSRVCADYSVDIGKYRKFYKKDRIWISNYRKWIDLLYDGLKEKHPLAKFYFVCLPVLMCSNNFYENPSDFTLPESLSYGLYNGCGYDSLKPVTVENQARYMAHSFLFREFLSDLSVKYENCGVLAPYKVLCEIPFEKRNSIFNDEFHLADQGNIILAKELAKEILNIIDISGNK